ncbi:L-serine ammonia-lyase [Rhodococcus opacus]|nr:L-serine ammonia-lyase [Rhodococcus opacus]
MSAYVSLTDLFSLGIGPSSSHTVGPMRAAADFVDDLQASGRLDRVDTVDCVLYGALAATGIGHGTPDAVVAGLAGARPETCDPEDVRGAWRRLGDGATVVLGGKHPVVVRERDVVFAPLTRMPLHTNALRLRAFDGARSTVADRVFYSVGDGFVVPEDAESSVVENRPAVPFPFTTACELLKICDATGMSIADVAEANEAALIGADRIAESVDRVWSAMVSCIEAGVATEGRLPGGLDVARRAPGLFRRLGSAGHDAIGSLVKANASISGAEAGCQGEVGSACAMAAGALCAVLGGKPAQVEYAAEIAMEHHLGLTCDPVGGLVQIPCIERNGIAAVTALSAARMALGGDGTHVVSLDTVIETMRQTGLDMSDKYKETSTGGLALNVVIC